MKPDALQAFIALYQKLDKHQLDQLSTVYSTDIHFVDPMSSLQGFAALKAHFENLYTHVQHCQFDIKDVQHTENEAFLTWRMSYAHTRLAGGKTIEVEGASHIKFNHQVHYHRDYVDLGQMLYEHIPVLGSAIRFIKQRATP